MTTMVTTRMKLLCPGVADADADSARAERAVLGPLWAHWGAEWVQVGVVRSSRERCRISLAPAFCLQTPSICYSSLHSLDVLNHDSLRPLNSSGRSFTLWPCRPSSSHRARSALPLPLLVLRLALPAQQSGRSGWSTILAAYPQRQSSQSNPGQALPPTCPSASDLLRRTAPVRCAL